MHIKGSQVSENQPKHPKVAVSALDIRGRGGPPVQPLSLRATNVMYLVAQKGVERYVRSDCMHQSLPLSWDKNLIIDSDVALNEAALRINSHAQNNVICFVLVRTQFDLSTSKVYVIDECYVRNSTSPSKSACSKRSTASRKVKYLQCAFRRHLFVLRCTIDLR